MTLRLGVRHWDHVVPLALGDVGGGALHIERLDTTPDMWTEDGLDGGETSFSRYVRARAAGDDRVVALPIFLMRGFRHRCIIVRADSAAKRPADLAHGRIGLTGWGDSGSVWTRAILREEGVGIDDVQWRVGPLTSNHPLIDRIGIDVVDSNVRHTDDGAALVDLLLGTDLDAVMTPFMPPGFRAADSPFRTLYCDTREAEINYFRRHGFVPGIHLLGLRSDVLRARPELGQQLVDAFEASKRLSRSRRDKLMDVTPWHNEDIAVATRILGDDWMPYGLTVDRPMVQAFQDELVAQRLLETPLPESDLFPLALAPATQEETA